MRWLYFILASYNYSPMLTASVMAARYRGQIIYVYSRNVPIQDVISVKSEEKTSTLSYVTKTAKKWVREEVLFTADERDVCVEWTECIEKALSDNGL